MTQLHAEGLDVKKIARPDGRYALEAPPERALAALRYIEENRLVRESGAGNLEPAGLGSGKEDRRFRAERALSRSIEATLDSIPGVLESRVHLNIPADDGIFGPGNTPRSKSTASVLIVSGSDADVPLGDIATLVGGAAGIPPSDVAVVFRTVPARGVGVALTPVSAEEPVLTLQDIGAQLTRYVRNAGWEVGVSLGILGLGLLRFGFRPKRKKVRRLHGSTAASAAHSNTEQAFPTTAGAAV